MELNAEKSAAEHWRELVYRGIESDTLDYKSPLDWNKMNHAQRAKLVRHAIAFANTRGGCIVIGVREDDAGRPVLYEGLSPEASRSFDPSAVGMFFNSCVEPPLDFTVERPTVDGKRYVIIVVRPFSALPHVCSRGVTGELQEGVFYIRTKSASSRPAYRAGELHTLVQHALRNQREELSRLLRGILFESSASDSPESGEAFRAELQSSTVYFTRRQKNDLKNLPAGQLLFSWNARPTRYLADRYPLAAITKAADLAVPAHSNFISGWEFHEAYNTNVALRYFSAEHAKMWQLFRSGQIHWMTVMDEPKRQLVLKDLHRFSMEALTFFGRYFSELGSAETVIDVGLHVRNTENWQLASEGFGQPYICRIPEIELHLQRSAASLAAGDVRHADALAREFANRFNVPSDQPLFAREP